MKKIIFILFLIALQNCYANSTIHINDEETVSLSEFLYAKDAPNNWKHLKINKRGEVVYRDKVIIDDKGHSINENTASDSYLYLKIYIIASGAKEKEGCDTSNYENGIYGLGCYVYESE